MLSEVFYTFLITSIVGCFLAVAKMLYRSKCRSCKIWGFEIVREIEVEERIDELEMQRSSAIGNNTI
jgi:Flp pilus assembly protein protease CpaA